MRVRSTPAITWDPASASAAPQTVSGAATPIVLGQIYAGFWLRALALLMDMLVLSLLMQPFLILLFPQRSRLWEQFSQLPFNQMFDLSIPLVRSVMAVTLPVAIVTGWLYYALCESSPWQGTLGKKLLGLTVTDLEGKRLSFAHASARFFSKIVSQLIPFGIGYVMAGFTRRKQALHDIIARCLVLRRH